MPSTTSSKSSADPLLRSRRALGAQDLDLGRPQRVLLRLLGHGDGSHQPDIRRARGQRPDPRRPPDRASRRLAHHRALSSPPSTPSRPLANQSPNSWPTVPTPTRCPRSWRRPMRERGVNLVFDLHANDRGCLLDPVSGVLWIDGHPYCHDTPVELRNIKRPNRLKVPEDPAIAGARAQTKKLAAQKKRAKKPGKRRSRSRGRRGPPTRTASAPDDAHHSAQDPCSHQFVTNGGEVPQPPRRRRGWDLNPRWVAPRRFSRPLP